MFRKGRLPCANKEEPRLNADPRASALDGTDDDAVGIQLPPAVKRHIGHRSGRRDRGVRVARDQRELALEVQIVPQHLRDRLRGIDGLGVFGEGDEVWHGQAWRRARLTGEYEGHGVGLARTGLAGGGAGCCAWATMAAATDTSARDTSRTGLRMTTGGPCDEGSCGACDGRRVTHHRVVLEVEVNGQRRVREGRGKRRQLASSRDGAVRGEVEEIRSRSAS